MSEHRADAVRVDDDRVSAGARPSMTQGSPVSGATAAVLPNTRRRLALAYMTSAGSKVSTAAVQILALPVMARVLGPERLGALLMLSALSSLFGIAAQGFTPAVTFGLSRAFGAGDAEREREEFWATAFLSWVVTIATLVVGGLALVFVDPDLVFGKHGAAFAGEVRWGMAALVLQLAIYASMAWGEGVRSGYQENYISNIFSGSASLLVIVSVLLAYLFAPNIAVFFLAVNAVPWAMQGLSLLTAYIARRHVFRGPVFARQRIRESYHRASGYTLAQIGMNLQLQGPVLLIGRSVGLDGAALYGGLIRLMYLLYGVVLSALQPILPYISSQIARRDTARVARGLGIAWVMILVLTLGIGGFIAVMGRWLMIHWLHLPDTAPPLFMLSMGLFALTYMSSHATYLILIILGMGAWGSRRLLLSGAVGITLSIVVTRLGDFWLIGLVQSAGLIVTSAIAFQRRLWRTIRTPDVLS